ncbi:MAG TPA: PQQ-binding-like beta-propeller repeat protein [Pirellulaceae bacterium]|nr:PQQ-binding-like beta-propeller repeat protein [Pirellulaceae bacterium]
MRHLQALAAIFAALVCGTIAVTLLAGCQPAVPPPSKTSASGTTSSTTSGRLPSTPAAEVPDDKPTPEKPEDKPADKSKEATPGAGDTAAKSKLANPALKAGDWNQWGGNSLRNNTPVAEGIVTEWAPGAFDRKTGAWKPESAKNIRWVTALGSQTYGNTVVAAGKVFVGTNNSSGYLKRYPADIDLGVLVCLNEADGKLLWQHNSEKLPTGRVHDWPLMGICCSPLVEGDRLWFVTSRGEVRCLDVDGFHDGTDDGRPESAEPARLFDVNRADDPAEDKVGGYIAALDKGEMPADLRPKFEAAGMPLPEGDVQVTADPKAKAPAKKWTFKADVNGSSRDFILTVAGPKLSAFKIITPADKDEADVIWSFDMMKELGTSQHNMCSCSVTSLGDILFVNSSNGVDEAHIVIPAPEAPSFIAMDKNTGKVFWTDNAPGKNILHGQWSSPTVAVLGGVPQVIFGGGDGWIYSFKADKGKEGKPERLWRFDINPKDSVLELGGRGTRNDIISTPVVYDDKVYFCTGQDPEHGEGAGIVWCIDPTKRGDISEKLAVNRAAPKKPIPVKREQAVVEADGDLAIDNPNSGVVWKYAVNDANGDKKIDFEEQFHRSICTAAIKNDLLYLPDFSGLFHCLDAKTGKVHWTYDMLAAAWGSPLIVGDKVYVGDEDGDILVFNLTKEKHDPVFEVNMGSSVYSTPIVANGVLYIAGKDHIFAIAPPKNEAAKTGE